jgi:hypothetical protein
VYGLEIAQTPFLRKFCFRESFHKNFHFRDIFRENFSFAMRIRIQEPTECVSRSEKFCKNGNLSRKASREQQFFAKQNFAKSERIFAYFRENEKRGFHFNPSS